MLLEFLGRRGHGIVVVLAIGYGIELLLYVLIKRFVSRLRPFVVIPGVTMLISPPDEFSFPSGHTAAAFVMTTVVAMWYPVLFLFVFPLALGVGVSRVYLGVHYPSDILAGAALGVFAGCVAMALVG